MSEDCVDVDGLSWTTMICHRSRWRDDYSDDSGGDSDERTVSSVSQCRQRRPMLDSSWNETMAAAYDYVLNYSYLDFVSASAMNDR